MRAILNSRCTVSRCDGFSTRQRRVATAAPNSWRANWCWLAPARIASPAQLADPPRGLALARYHRRGQMTCAGQDDKLLKRIELQSGRLQTCDPLLHVSGTAEQRAALKVEANCPMAIAEQPVLDMVGIDFNRNNGATDRTSKRSSAGAEAGASLARSTRGSLSMLQIGRASCPGSAGSIHPSSAKRSGPAAPGRLR